jgi:uncharacterized protein YjbJ (UPF0337 family)
VVRRTDLAESRVHPLHANEALTCGGEVIDNVFEEHSMNKDQVKGRMKTAKGELKVVTGSIVGNERLAEKGKVEKMVGKIQTGYGDLKNKLKSDK